MSLLVSIITAAGGELRNRALDDAAAALDLDTLFAETRALEDFRRSAPSLYERVRALFFLSALHRYHFPARLAANPGSIPFSGHAHLLERRYEEAIRTFLEAQTAQGPSAAISSALSAAYRGLAFQTLANQVRRSVRSIRGNQWMFRCGHPANFPLSFRPELTQSQNGLFPVLRESTPVRMDLTHSGWSDIFFLGMDYPEGARVINISVDLSVREEQEEAAPRPPVEAWFRVIDEPVIRLSSVDLQASTELTAVAEVFDFARDYLGLLKAAVIAAGIVPPGLEGSGAALAPLLEKLTGRPGHGFELVSKVNDIPKGSRLAVSTSLLASLIAVLMRATRQASALTGPLGEDDRRLVAARAILGEWMGGSGGGWQDSGGVWPGIKLIRGELAQPGDVEHGVSRGCLLPRHTVYGPGQVSPETRRNLEASLVLVHGGMAQDVGPILEMVTERYLLRSAAEWEGRRQAVALLDEMLALLLTGDIRGIGRLTQRNFEQPIRAIIPWATNAFTERVIATAQAEFKDDFWGFWMLGGMAGGGMGFLFAPHRKNEAGARLRQILRETKRELQGGVPFAMEPVIYNFKINDRGTWADLLSGGDALFPAAYYTATVPKLIRQDTRLLSPARRAELERFASASRTRPEYSGIVESLFDHLLPQAAAPESEGPSLQQLLDEQGFDSVQHERIRADLRAGRIGLAQNQLAVSSLIEDVRPGDVTPFTPELSREYHRRGLDLLAAGAAAVVTLAGGAGSRWTRGAGVVKALHPFIRLQGRHRTFLETHLAKSRRVARECGAAPAHVFTTSYLTHSPAVQHLAAVNNYAYEGPIHLSPGRSAGLRMIPMARDLRFAWEEMPQQKLDERQEKVRASLRATLLDWARAAGEGSDYTDNLPSQCLHPTGHWYEIPNLLRNGVLHRLLAERPRLRYLLIHNIDTLGATLDPALLAWHAGSGAACSFEVIPRWLEDRGGGLARIDGELRLIEGLALPSEEVEFGLSWYSTLTTWVDLDRLLKAFRLTRDDLNNQEKVSASIRALANRLPTYITIKDVKKRWGRGQEDVFPVTQFEKLWGDMTTLRDLDCRYLAVPRLRGQQLKDISQLDPWLRDGSAAYLESICDFL